ncbi:hypothetical protein PR202_gb17082 [Eleusine coracana subsp. coracana]|uniref:Uncharacterized protein n=1 Tax=Eleusine coracana subsp. coracana TaxID=191504 RepID=A0AAV5F213_ELECO|nr:hypothetical protein PR202_gb17082 [Eleusine coracana subsp. coracana]
MVHRLTEKNFDLPGVEGLGEVLGFPCASPCRLVGRSGLTTAVVAQAIACHGDVSMGEKRERRRKEEEMEEARLDQESSGNI